MVKRVYFETVKKWLIASGISVGTLVGGLFLYLNLMGVIEITGHSGDSVCMGTSDDPCYAYVNLTAKEDIFIYPVGADPWGRNTIMEFSPGVKDWKLQRSWGNGWRDIPLNETCSGRWCGAPNNLGVKYSYVLREDRDYKFRIVAYKNSPFDKIKWAVNYDGREYLDPTWKSPYKVTHTRTTDAICKDGVCNKILYSGVRNVQEDDEWKRVENAKSLKDKGFEIIYLEDDPDFEIEIIDFNLTSITVDLNSKQKNKDIPVRLWKVNNSKNRTGDYKKDYQKIKDEKININKDEKIKKTYEFGMDSILEFGFNSTTIKLQDNETENLGDVELWAAPVGPGAPDNITIQIMFNLSSLSSGHTITDSKLCFYWTNIYNSTGLMDDDVNISRVNNYTWTESSSAENFYAHSLENSSLKTWSSITQGTWGCVNVTDIVKEDYDNGMLNTSIRLIDPDYPPYGFDGSNDVVYSQGQSSNNVGSWGGQSNGDMFYWTTRENGSASYITYLNITYSIDTTKPTYSNNAHNTTLAGQSVKFSILYNDDTALHPAGQYIFSTNNTGSWVNESAVNFTATPNWANVTKTLNSTEGLSIGYRWFADDNAGNINNTGIFTLTTTELSLDLELIYPLTDFNATQNEFFNVTVNVTCRGGNCGEVNVSLDPYEVGDWEKDGDLVYFEDTNAYLSAEPHTLSSSDWVYFNVTPHLFSGNVNAVWGVDNSDGVKFTSPQLFKPHYVNWTTDHSQFFQNVSNIDVVDGTCDYGNSYNPIKVNITYQICGEWNDSEMGGCLFYNTTYSLACLDSYTHDEDDYTIYWATNHSRLENWLDISDKFDKINYDYDGFDTWYRLQDVNVNAGQNYQIRAYLEVPIGLNNVNGKYGWAVYRSSDTISQAIANEHFYYLDPWFNSSWTYKKDITINHSKVNGSQTNFPVLINLTDTDLRDDAQADGDDIAFTNSTGSQLDHEIEYFNSTTGYLVAWVRIPTLSNTTDTVIQMYYGNAGASNQENATGVWDDNFVMVQHLSETPSGTTYDSTSNNNDGTTHNMDSADQVAGQIDGSLDFDGDNDYVEVSDDASAMGLTDTAGTISAWFKAYAHGGINGYIVAHRDGTENNRLYLFVHATSDDFFCGFGDDYDAITSNNNVENDGLFHAGAMTWDTIGAIGYLDGVSIGTYNYDLPTVDGIIGIGRLQSMTQYFNGVIDEVRISNTARSAGWIATEYNNQVSPSSFYSVGSEEEEPADEAKGLVNDTIGATPFYTNQSNPRNISLSQDESQLVTFWVNATGEIDTTHVFFAYINLTSNMSISNITNEWNVTIVEAEAEDTCTYTTGNWNVDCNDNCLISSNVNLGGNNLTLSGTGVFNVQANISNFGYIFKPNGCQINIFNSGGLSK